MEKTLILPTDEKALARRLFQQYVHDEPFTLIVVVGKGDTAETTVRRAAKLAGTETEPRWVVWARKPEQIAEDIAALGDSDKVMQADAVAADVLAFAVSLRNRVTDVVKADEEPDFFRLTEAWNSTTVTP